MTERVIGRNSTSTVGQSGEPSETTTDRSGEVAVDSRKWGDEASPWGKFAGIAVAALMVAISPDVASKTFTPKYAVMLLIGAVGVVPLMRALWRGQGRTRLATLGALGFLVVGLVSALVSAAPNIGIFGLYLWGTGWLLWLSCVGAFGIGLQLGRRDVDWVFGGVLLGAVANAILAIYQVVGHPTSATFGGYSPSQADGFLGNPVFLESLLLGAIALVGVRALRAPLKWAAPLMLLSVALEFTDERFALAVLVVTMAALVLYGKLRGLLISALIAVGYGVGYVGGGSSLGARLQQGTGSVGFHLRLDVWRAAAQALVHRPLIGYGPGELEAATAPHVGRLFQQSLGPAHIFTDAHNVLVEITVTTGLLGLACFVVWVLAGISRAKNALIFVTLVVFAVELVEPLNIAVTPLAFLCLGAAGISVNGPSVVDIGSMTTTQAEVWPRFATAGLVVVALGVGGTMLAGDAAYNSSPPRGYVFTAAKRANELMPYWPQPASGMSLFYQYYSVADHQRSTVRHDVLMSRNFAKDSADRAPFDPLEWVDVGEADLHLGRYGSAIRQFEHALRDEPWNPPALDGLAATAVDQHKWLEAVKFYAKEASALTPGHTRSVVEKRLIAAKHHRVYRGSSR